MSELVEKAKKHLGVEEFVATRMDGVSSELVVLVDEGIAGIKKTRIPLSALEGGDAADDDEELSAMRERAKEAGIKGWHNMKRETLEEALADVEKGEND